MFSFIINLLGGYTDKEFSKMHSGLCNRVLKERGYVEYEAERGQRYHKFAMDLASRYRDEEYIKRITETDTEFKRKWDLLVRSELH